MCNLINALILRHNSHIDKVFEGQKGRVAYSLRKELAEYKVIHKALRAYCKQVVDKINQGSPTFSNILWTNNFSLRTGGHKSGTPRILGKWAYAGFLLGEPEPDDGALRYRDQLTQGGYGFGVRPLKREHGRKKNFELLINPSCIPVETIEAECAKMGLEVRFVSTLTLPYVHYPHNAQSSFSELAGILSNGSIIGESFAQLKDKKENLDIKILVDSLFNHVDNSIDNLNAKQEGKSTKKERSGGIGFWLHGSLDSPERFEDKKMVPAARLRTRPTVKTLIRGC